MGLENLVISVEESAVFKAHLDALALPSLDINRIKLLLLGMISGYVDKAEKSGSDSLVNYQKAVVAAALRSTLSSKEGVICFSLNSVKEEARWIYRGAHAPINNVSREKARKAVSYFKKNPLQDEKIDEFLLDESIADCINRVIGRVKVSYKDNQYVLSSNKMGNLPDGREHSYSRSGYYIAAIPFVAPNPKN